MENILLGFETAFSLTNIIFCFAGVFIGTFIGVLPGIGSLAAVSMLLPITFYLDPATALIMLGGIYYGAEYGGSTASILLNLPGTPSNAVTCLDGYPMAKNGRAGVALFTTSIASFIGGSFGIIVLMFLTPQVVAFSLTFGPAEYFAVLLFGLLAAGAVAQGSVIKGLAMVGLGMLLGTIGADVNSGAIRYTFGLYDLYDGISIVIIAMGLFGISEVIASVNSSKHDAAQQVTLRSLIPNREEARRSVMPIVRGMSIGSLLGPLPGTGPSISAFLSYVVEKKISKDPSRFGNGAIEGVASPEASNNASVQTAFIPTLALGIPGSATMALMLGALMLHGIAPGPTLMTDYPDLFWGVIASFWIGNLMLLVLNVPLIGIWVRLLNIPYALLYPGIVCLICIGVFSVHNSPFDVALLLVVGALGYGMRLLSFEPAPLLIGFILGPLLEENLRRALLISNGDFLALFMRPVSGSLLAIAILIVAFMAYTNIRRYREQRRAEAAKA